MGSAEVVHKTGKTHDGDPPSETNENQPLYTDTLGREPDGSIAIPDKQATPQQVRTFIAQLLVAKRSLDVDHARSIAARWTIGNGHEMDAWSVKRYAEIFGDEDGRIVYKDVKVILHNAGRGRRKTEAVCALVGSLSVSLGLVTQGSLAVSKSDNDFLSAAGFFIAILALACSFFCVIIVFIITVEDSEDVVEKRLSDYFDSSWRQRPKQT
ncbi:hypothetical protein MBLNU230_g3855t1 [Neophaeotheca triangularis]